MKTDNELIAEFIGFSKSSGEIYYSVPESYKNLTYNEDIIEDTKTQLFFADSWDWLMPVVEKINNLFDNGKMEGFDTDIFRSMQDWILSVNIENAYADLVEIIKWYNQQKA